MTAFAGAYPEDMALLAGFDHSYQKPADPFILAAGVVRARVVPDHPP